MVYRALIHLLCDIWNSLDIFQARKLSVTTKDKVYQIKESAKALFWLNLSIPTLRVGFAPLLEGDESHWKPVKEFLNCLSTTSGDHCYNYELCVTVQRSAEKKMRVLKPNWAKWEEKQIYCKRGFKSLRTHDKISLSAITQSI